DGFGELGEWRSGSRCWWQVSCAERSAFERRCAGVGEDGRSRLERLEGASEAARVHAGVRHVKPRQMPQQTLARLTDLQERVENLEREAASAESEVARLRSLLRSNSGNPASLDEINAAKASFDAVFTAAQLARSKATAQAKLLAGVKSWLAGLGANVKLVLV